jgi:1-acyl-sn-glycerol-3-phosphate acyltransferase
MTPPGRVVLAALARLVSGVSVRWAGCQPETRQRVYFANHTSHLDFVVLWSVLPSEVRAFTRPVAARDYWEAGTMRRYVAADLFNAILVQRRNAGVEGCARQLDLLLEAMGDRYSLIMFPEGTRGTGDEIGPFRSGIYHLSLRKPDLELVPVYLHNLGRILPKGECIPVPMLSRIDFGAPIRVLEGEPKEAFLGRARETLRSLRCR